MAVRDTYLVYVVEQLGRVRPVTWRRMFGAVGVYVDGKIVGVIDNDTVYFRTDDTNREEYVSRGMAAFQPMGPDTKPMAYHELPGDLLEDPGRLAAWLAGAVAAAERAASRPKRSSKRAVGRPREPRREAR